MQTYLSWSQGRERHSVLINSSSPLQERELYFLSLYVKPRCEEVTQRLFTASGEERAKIRTLEPNIVSQETDHSLHLRAQRRLVFEIHSTESETFPVILCPSSNLSQVWCKSVESASTSLLPTKCHGRVRIYTQCSILGDATGRLICSEISLSHSPLDVYK